MGEPDSDDAGPNGSAPSLGAQPRLRLKLVLGTLPPDRISWCEMTLDEADFTRLLQLRTGLRRFLRWSEQQARAAGLTPAKHQLLLAIRGHPNPSGPTIGEVADYLLLRHHSAVGLIDRAAADGLVRRNPDPLSKSTVRVALTQVGLDKLDALSEAHLEELAHLAPTMRALWRALDKVDGHRATTPS